MAKGIVTSLLASFLMAFYVGVTSIADLLQRESQLLHNYGGWNIRRESFQRISNLSGKRTQVK